ncbi:hypothetical protein SAMN05216227_1003146 [Pseudorhodobacter antarcticus]|uniref:Uncharacterized protein n=1 Tax=Pseudorhodobacter antarcticus TaxID=1077947 RepID=A0A1H8BTL8_9RHOB|nr:hypothetical protein SAMN05216227_1003146 [Pseudorhodobacter antarcticus]
MRDRDTWGKSRMDIFEQKKKGCGFASLGA